MTRMTGKDTRFIIIGSGISGVLMAIKLLEQGYRNFTALEKAEVMGGTWRDNVYPGVACDVAAHLYSYSFARNPAWPTRYAKGAEIWRYHHDVARRFGVLPQMLPGLLAYGLLRFAMTVRGAAVLGFVGAGGIGQELIEAIRKFYYNDVAALLVLIILTVSVIDILASQLRHRLLQAEAAR